MLTLEALSAGYGEFTVLRDVNLTIGEGEVVALLGPNGAGKTTLLRAATGLVRPRSGRISFRGEDLTGKPPHVFVRRGICHLPEGRGIFPSLTVQENLRVQARTRDKREAVAETLELFPGLKNRLGQTAGSLSGGEQQMLALSRAYLTGPRLVVVDEASLGLAPLMVDKIYDALETLVQRGMSLIVVEQYVQKALSLAKTVYVLSHGSLVHIGDADKTDPEEIYERYLGIDQEQGTQKRDT
jgi:branched-chain amino acid transport system ATP-binding protein